MNFKTILRWVKLALRFAFFLSIAMVFLNLGVMYERYGRNGESLINFLTQERVYQGKEAIQSIEYKGQVNLLETIKRNIWVALIFLWSILTIDYFIDPEHHFITAIKKRVQDGG